MTQVDDLVVVGAGPYGLSIAAHAAAAGLGVRVLGRPMASWRDHMPEGMYLKSEPWSSNLSAPGGRHTLAAYCATRGRAAEHGSPLPIGTFSSYGMWFARHAAPEVEEVTVTEVSPQGDGFLIRTAEGPPLLARTVAIAVGVMPFVHLPEALRDLPPGTARTAAATATWPGSPAGRSPWSGPGRRPWRPPPCWPRTGPGPVSSPAGPG